MPEAYQSLVCKLALAQASPRCIGTGSPLQCLAELIIRTLQGASSRRAHGMIPDNECKQAGAKSMPVKAEEG